MRNAHFPSKTAKALRTRYESNPSLDPNGKRGPFTACEDSELLRLRQVEHLPWRAIAMVLGRSSNSVNSRFIYLVDFRSRSPIPQVDRLTEEEKQEVRKLRAEGKYVRDIATATKHSTSTVRYIVYNSDTWQRDYVRPKRVFTKSEDAIIFTSREEGLQWVDTARKLPYRRTYVALNDRYDYLLRKAIAAGGIKDAKGPKQ